RDSHCLDPPMSAFCASMMPQPSAHHFLREMDFDLVMILEREEETVEYEASKGARLVEADGVDERRQPAAVVSEIEEFIEIAETQLGLERLALPHDEAFGFEEVKNLLWVGRAGDQAVDVKSLAAEHPAQEFVVGGALKGRVRPLGGAEVGPDPAIFEP